MTRWEPLGPDAVLSANYGLVSGRIFSLALDASDTNGNRLYVGSIGAGIWFSQNAAAPNPADVVFTQLTDQVLSSLTNQADSPDSVDIRTAPRVGALSVHAGVILAGTGNPNDPLDPYYGIGILRSTDNGNTWRLIQKTSDLTDGYSDMDYGLLGESVAGFAWSTSDSSLVVAAVSQGYQTALPNAAWAGFSYAGLYYSADSGANWHLARITDGNSNDVQGPLSAFAAPDGNAATAVVWNPVRKVFIAAVRFHGYYQSPDGVTWMRIAVQPGRALTALNCPANSGSTGSTTCPIWRGALAVNPQTGDTFAWTVDVKNQDQGLWQDVCSPSGACSDSPPAFSTPRDTAALQTSTALGQATIENGDYNLALAALPSAEGTVLLAGANDVWRCSLAASGNCTWRNTTNATACASARVGPHQHVLEWNAADPQTVFAGNDSGLWRSPDGIGVQATACSPDDANHFQNLNGGFASLAEVESLSPVAATPYMMAGLGGSGTAAASGSSGPTASWPQILGGWGGPVAADPGDASKWYVNNGPGVSIHGCATAPQCTTAEFGASPAVSNAQVAGDGASMTNPAPFLVDPADSSQLLIATCRVWRGPASGNGWSAANAVSPMLDGVTGPRCSGNALIRSIAALPLPGGGEIVYAGAYGALGGGAVPGHVFSATMDAHGVWPTWRDLRLNSYGFDISSLFIDPSDTTGNTVYATVAGPPTMTENSGAVYRSTDGGTDWTSITSNLPAARVNSLVVDPVDANTVYAATDLGVFSTRHVSLCGSPGSSCWAPYGDGLPQVPVVALSASPPAASPNVLVAATYGRGVWQTPLLTAGTQLTTAAVNPAALGFADQPQSTNSSPLAVTLINTGAIALVITSVTASGDFTRTENCTVAALDENRSCTIQVTFSPTQTGSRAGELVIAGNIAGGSLRVPLSGTGLPPPSVTVTPAAVNFPGVQIGGTSAPLQITVENSGAAPVPVASITVTGPFLLASNSCGNPIAAKFTCQMTLQFVPAAAGDAVGVFTMVDAAGTQTVQLFGRGTAPPADTLSPDSLTFAGTPIGGTSAAQTVTLSNSGDNPLTSIAASVSGPFELSNHCTTQLAGQSSCAIDVTYLPDALGEQNGVLTVADILKTQVVNLSGIGLLPPALAVSPSSLDFGGQQVNLPSAPAVLTVMNGTSAPVQGIAFQITGQLASAFSISASTCGDALPPGAACALQLVFSPTALGPASAALAISSSSAGVPSLAVPLRGSGQVFDFTLSFSGTSMQTVASGQTAIYTLSLAPSGGVPAAFVFQCGSLPQFASCVFNPSTNSLAAGVTGTEMVQVRTSQAVSSGKRLTFSRGAGFLLACALFAFPLALRRRSRALRLLALLAVAAGITDCASSGGGSSGNAPALAGNATPASTYSIPVVVSANNIRHSITLTLVVE